MGRRVDRGVLPSGSLSLALRARSDGGDDVIRATLNARTSSTRRRSWIVSRRRRCEPVVADRRRRRAADVRVTGKSVGQLYRLCRARHVPGAHRAAATCAVVVRRRVRRLSVVGVAVSASLMDNLAVNRRRYIKLDAKQARPPLSPCVASEPPPRRPPSWACPL